MKNAGVASWSLILDNFGTANKMIAHFLGSLSLAIWLVITGVGLGDDRCLRVFYLRSDRSVVAVFLVAENA